MVCQNCGTQLPDGTPACPTCGAQLAAQQPYMDPNQMFNQAPAAAPAKKNNTGMIIGIVVAVVAVIAIILVAVNLLGGSEYDGKYKLTSCASMGMEFTVEQMEAMSGESFDMTLEVKGSRCTLDAKAMGYDKASCKIKFDGDEVTLIDGDETLVGTYDADAKSITISASGVDMIFTLQD
ncbi:MAG: zinc ribbon domain-containing protein [Lachnospiraceae bacterium]|nr:zinc ribbon domain-containing protein [Lachnospiraceae bacterium]